MLTKPTPSACPDSNDSIALASTTAAQRERLSALGQASSIVAHEIRNPLMIIKSSIHNALHSPVPPHLLETMIEIGAQVERLTSIVNEVLDFVRPLRFHYEPADLNGICSESAKAVMACEPGIRIHVALDASLPIMVTDSERLRAALINLLANACQAVRARSADSPEEGGESPEPSVEISTSRREGDRVVIAVRDRGVGMSMAEAERAFDPYFTTKPTGNGLGLPIVRSVIAGLEGTITIRSELGVGTEVRIDLPGQPSYATASPLCPAAAGCELFAESMRCSRLTVPGSELPCSSCEPAAQSGVELGPQPSRTETR